MMVAFNRVVSILREAPDRTLKSFSTYHRQRRAIHRPRTILGKATVIYWEKCRRDTWFLPFTVLCTVFLLYLIFPDSQLLQALIFPSYKIPPKDGSEEAIYGKGPRDILFVLYWAFFFAFAREVIMQKVLRPLASGLGLSRGKVKRFMEQTYTILYFSLFGPWGLYIMSRTSMWFFRTEQFWVEYPHKTHIAMFKCYYLGELAYWTQQAFILALRLEKPRKDFKELVLHHIVTLLLITLSYVFHFTWIGLAVFITMDISDIFLALSKTLNYLDHILTVPVYLLFIIIWSYLRHYTNLRILWSVLTEFNQYDPVKLNWAAGQFKCIWSQTVTFILLAMLQAVNLFWLSLILRIGYRVLSAGVKKDDRSDDEDT